MAAHLVLNPTSNVSSTYLRERLHARRFVTVDNPHGVSGADTVFHYRVDGPVISAAYAGGCVLAGHVIARATGPDTIETLYHSLTSDTSDAALRPTSIARARS